MINLFSSFQNYFAHLKTLIRLQEFGLQNINQTVKFPIFLDLMGVRGLSTILNANPKSSSQVVLSHSQGEENRSLAIDGPGLLHYLASQTEWRLGCYFEQLKSVFKNFLLHFLFCKLKLFIFFDGVADESKITTHTDRLLQNSRKGLEFQKFLAKNNVHYFRKEKKPLFCEQIFKIVIAELLESNPDSLVTIFCPSEADTIIANFVATHKDVRSFNVAITTTIFIFKKNSVLEYLLRTVIFVYFLILFIFLCHT